MNTTINIESDLKAIAKIEAINRLLEVICSTAGMGFAAVARVNEEQWIVCAVRDEMGLGVLPGEELKVEATPYQEIRQPIVIANADDGSLYAYHVSKKHALKSYISVPIYTKTGVFFGVLCALDPKPAQINNAEIINLFVLFADLIAFHLQAIADVAEKKAQLIEAKEMAELRDKFISILGHDVRNPVGAILNVAELLLRMPVEERVKKMAMIVQSSTQRMQVLVENILDFTRGHLGSGIKLYVSENEPLEEMFSQVVHEFRLISPDYKIETDFNVTHTFSCDGKRLSQLLSNLVSNGLTHGKNGAVVKVMAKTVDNEFLLIVVNEGDEIPPIIMKKLFQPFYKGDIDPTARGLGLGLYIASEIAKAHKGLLEVESVDGLTSFTFRMGF